MDEKTYNVLFLCTGNSARSIMAESILGRLGQGRFNAFSAGSHPAGAVNPCAIELLKRSGHAVDGLRSKGWSEFASPGAPEMDVVVTVCDRAAGEICPVWPGQPDSAHWSVPDPAAVASSEAEKRAAFADDYHGIHGCIARFVELPIATIDGPSLKRRLTDLARENPRAPAAAELT
jgi:arsenate reductase